MITSLNIYINNLLKITKLTYFRDEEKTLNKPLRKNEKLRLCKEKKSYGALIPDISHFMKLPTAREILGCYHYHSK